MPGDFILTLQTILVMVFQFAIIIEETDHTHPEGGYDHQDHIYVGEVADQQTG